MDDAGEELQTLSVVHVSCTDSLSSAASPGQCKTPLSKSTTPPKSHVPHSESLVVLVDDDRIKVRYRKPPVTNKHDGDTMTTLALGSAQVDVRQNHFAANNDLSVERRFLQTSPPQSFRSIIELDSAQHSPVGVSANDGANGRTSLADARTVPMLMMHSLRSKEGHKCQLGPGEGYLLAFERRRYKQTCRAPQADPDLEELRASSQQEWALFQEIGLLTQRIQQLESKLQCQLPWLY